MYRLRYFPALVVVASLASCERWHWPPYENDLRDMFAQSSTTLAELEREMVGDGLPIIGTGLNRAWRRDDIPELTEAQTNKYATLFGTLPFHATVQRSDTTTYVELIDQAARFRDFQFAFVRGDGLRKLPACDDADRFADCGECYVTLDAEWRLEYRWSNGDGIPSPDGCVDPKLLDLDAD